MTHGAQPRRLKGPRQRRVPRDDGSVMAMAVIGLVVVAMAVTAIIVAAHARSRAISTEAHIVHQDLIRQANTIRVDEILAASDGAVDPGDTLRPVMAWQNPDGDARWRVQAVTPVGLGTKDPGLLGEAQRTLVDVTFQWATGCQVGIVLADPDDPEALCELVGVSSRRYERRSFLHYLMHYDEHTFPTRWCGPVQECNDAGGGAVVFADGDRIGGPIHTNGSTVLYCSAAAVGEVPAPPDFAAEPEVYDASPTAGRTATPALVAAPLSGCNVGRPTLRGVLVSRLTLPALDVRLDVHLPGASLRSGGPYVPACGTETRWLDDGLALAVGPDAQNSPVRVELTDAGLREFAYGSSTDPRDPPAVVSPLAVSADIEVFGVASRSVTVVASGDITVVGDISAPAGEVVALVAGCDVVLDPGGRASTATLLWAGQDSLEMDRVAVLAPAGGLRAEAWHLPHDPRPECDGVLPADQCLTGAGPPVLTFTSAVASEHLGLFGQVGPPQTGWIKDFDYPDSCVGATGATEAACEADGGDWDPFWEVSPPWWPHTTASAWTPV